MIITVPRKALGLLGASVAVLSLPVIVAVPSYAAAGSAQSASSEVGTQGRPSGCDYGLYKGINGSWAGCDDDNGGSWRAIAICKSPTKGTLVSYGGWSRGAYSLAYCNADSTVQSAGIETITTRP